MNNSITRNLFIEQSKLDKKHRRLAKWLGISFFLYFGGHVAVALYRNW